MTLSNLRKTAGSADGFASVDRANDTAFLISEKPTVITVYRDSAARPAQTVRLESLTNPNTFRYFQDAELRETSADTLVIGYKSHATIADTDLITGDRFEVGNDTYEVVQLFPGIPDRLLAFAEVSDYGS